MSTSRVISRNITPTDTSDGAGVSLKRSIGGSQIDHLDPFLLLDEFKSDDPNDYISGFPDHPHRGFETVTYMLAGVMEHRDHKGNCGKLVAGSVQWMTAGRGIIHSEMPQQENGLMWGFQLWVNLPSQQKMIEPRYQDIPPEDIPIVEVDGVKVKVIAGETYGTKGPVTGIVTNPLYIDVHMHEDQSYFQPIPQDQNAFIYVYVGSITIDSQVIKAPKLLVLKKEDGKDGISVHSNSEDAKLLIVAATPIGEPIARAGPFVMNTREELIKAFSDFQSGRLQL